MKEHVIISEKELINLYCIDKLTTYQIAKKLNCCPATARNLLIRYNIKRRKSHDLNSNIPLKDTLLELYKNKKMSTWKIEEEYGYSRGTIYRKLKEYGIKTRDLADSHIIYPRKKFSGDLIEKAYLIGFKLGDLGVRKIHPNSKTICVASGSTIKEQIELIKELFEKYGRIWIKKTKDNKINIQANLDLSFDFLLDKTFPLWVEKNREHFFSFLAGFTDAEGTISTNKNKSYYSLSNCNEIFLEKIKENLRKFEIPCNDLTVDNRKGKTTFIKYNFNFNYWTLRINCKEDLLKLLNLLQPYIKHKNKVKALNIAIQNINMRNDKYGK